MQGNFGSILNKNGTKMDKKNNLYQNQHKLPLYGHPGPKDTDLS